MIVTSRGMRMGLFVLVWIVSVVSSTELSRVLKATNEFAVFGLPVKPTWHAVIMKEHVSGTMLSARAVPRRRCSASITHVMCWAILSLSLMLLRTSWGEWFCDGVRLPGGKYRGDLPEGLCDVESFEPSCPNLQHEVDVTDGGACQFAGRNNYHQTAEWKVTSSPLPTS